MFRFPRKQVRRSLVTATIAHHKSQTVANAVQRPYRDAAAILKGQAPAATEAERMDRAHAALRILQDAQ